MKVLLVNTSERIGGAAIAANRLMNALRRNGVTAQMLVRDKQTDSVCVCQLRKSWWHVWQFLWERMVIWVNNWFHKANLFAVDIANTGTDITTLPEFKQADVIHLHWINQGMLGLGDLRRILLSGKPVVWTMHDMWPCTGICHHARECERYLDGCERCPYLYRQGSRHDLSHAVYRRKQALYQLAPIQFVTCSQWLGRCASRSGLLAGQGVSAIPNPIDTEVFRPMDREAARAHFHLPKQKKLLLFGSVRISDKRKGIDYFVASCRQLVQSHPILAQSIGVVVYGRDSEQLVPLLPFQVYALDYIASEDELVQVYNAADVYVTPSLEENLPNTIMEAMSCGLPCVGFNVGGIPEMIDHQQNGYVARYKSADDLAHGIGWVLGNPAVWAKASELARRKVEQAYSQDAVAQRYVEVYHQALDCKSHANR